MKKKIIMLLIVFMMIFTLSSCKSKEEKMFEAYFEQYYPYGYHLNEKIDMGIHLLGTYNGATAIYVKNNAFPDMIYTSEIDGNKFITCCSLCFIGVYYKGELILLRGAYEKGIISSKQLKKIHKKYIKAHESYHDEGSGWCYLKDIELDVNK